MAENKDLGQVGLVRTVADGDCVFAEVGGSVARVKLEDFVNRMAGDSAAAMETLKAVKEALAAGADDAAVAMLNKIGANTSAIEGLQEKEEQYTIKGTFLDKNGGTGPSAGSSISEYIPLNRSYPVILQNVTAKNNAVGLHFYDCNKHFISIPDAVKELNSATATIPIVDFPAGACFFRVCTEKSGSSYSNGPTREAREGAVVDAIVSAKEALFIDEWNAAWGINGKYDPKNAPDKQHPYYGNRIWMTYNEAMAVMTAGARQTSTLSAAYISSSIRTHLPRIGSGQAAEAGSTFYGCSRIEVVEMPNMVLKDAVFNNCTNLRQINLSMAIYNLNAVSAENFKGCKALVEIRGYIRGPHPISFADSPLLSLASLQFMVTSAMNTSAVTITVHADVYAKLSDTANAEWHKVMTDAAAKNISFATAA